MTATTTVHVPSTTTPSASSSPKVGDGAAGVLPRLAGVALAAGPVVFLAGLLTSPPGDTTVAESSIRAFAQNPTQTQVSALLLHYGLLLMALGLLRAPSLVRGRRGSLLVLLGSLGTSVGMLNVSGSLKDDWWRMAAGQSLSMPDALAVVETADSASLLGFWNGTEPLAFLGVLLVLGGLARAGVLSWGWLATAIACFVGTMVVPGHLQVWPSVVFGAFVATLVPAGLRLLQRSRLG